MKNKDQSVLVIDDEDIALDIVSDFLQQFGFQAIHTAGDGRSGLRLLDRMPQSPAYIIVDVFMPDMDGIEFLGELAKRNFKGAVILISALDPQMLQLAREIALGSGLKLFAALSKPFEKSTLAEALGLAPAEIRSLI